MRPNPDVESDVRDTHSELLCQKARRCEHGDSDRPYLPPVREQRRVQGREPLIG
jgi:hypothetical protein